MAIREYFDGLSDYEIAVLIFTEVNTFYEIVEIEGKKYIKNFFIFGKIPLSSDLLRKICIDKFSDHITSPEKILEYDLFKDAIIEVLQLEREKEGILKFDTDMSLSYKIIQSWHQNSGIDTYYIPFE